MLMRLASMPRPPVRSTTSISTVAASSEASNGPAAVPLVPEPWKPMFSAAAGLPGVPNRSTVLLSTVSEPSAEPPEPAVWPIDKVLAIDASRPARLWSIRCTETEPVPESLKPMRTARYICLDFRPVADGVWRWAVGGANSWAAPLKLSILEPARSVVRLPVPSY